ncbi:hypothetical protein [Streptomyces sp. NPDC059278]|uniref:hypothetical protein n=1 Tax=Streptomyces sp. NPDC059278 TaxID=3346801 RepID=UPI0036987033
MSDRTRIARLLNAITHTGPGYDTHTPTCQWCSHPITGPVAWWDDRPQCPNPHACTQRITEEPTR